MSVDQPSIESYESAGKLPQVYSHFYSPEEEKQFFKYDSETGLPVSIKLDDKKIQVDCSVVCRERLIDSRKPIDRSLFVNVGLLQALMNYLEIQKATKIELQLSGVEVTGDVLTDAATSVDVWRQLNPWKGKPLKNDQLLPEQVLEGVQGFHTEDINRWRRKLSKDRVPISIKQVKTHGPDCKFTFVKLGKVDDQQNQWFQETSTIREIFKMYSLLGIPPLADLTVYEISEMDGPSELMTHLRNNHSFTCGGSSGVVGGFPSFEDDKREIFLFPRARPILTGPGYDQVLEIDSRELTVFTKHEVAHLLDVQRKRWGRNIPAAEGFATAAMLDFNIESIKRSLSRYSTRDITIGQLNNILSLKPTTVQGSSGSQESVTTVEKYYVSASFLAYVFNQVGAEKFMEFYASLYRRKTFLSVVNNLCKSNGLSSRDFLNGYFEVMNNRKTFSG